MRDPIDIGRPIRSFGRAAVRAVVSVMIMWALTACSFGEPTDEQPGEPPQFPSSASASPGEEPTGGTSEIVRDLTVPWGLDFLPDGTALVTERDSKRIIALKKPTYQKETIATINEAQPSGEGGLLGLAVSPAYAQDNTVFVYYTAANDNRIAALKLDGSAPRPIVTGIPKSGIHNGGRIAFGPDGFLYAGTGDSSDRALSQNRDSLAGKILRMTADGKPAPGNPFNTLIYSYGHRNIQGLAWDAQKNLWATEFGQNEWDEINLIRTGGNYGWPTVEGKGGRAEFVDPVVTWRPAEASCSGLAASGQVLAAACLRGKRLWIVQLNGRGGVLGTPIGGLVDAYGRLRTIVRAPDGTMWVTTSNKDGRGTPRPGDDKIIRVVLTGAGGVSKA